MRIGILEDDQAQSKWMELAVADWAKSNHYICETFCYLSAESFLFSKEDQSPFDVLFLDIQMDKMTGVELAKKLRGQKDDVIIIFITAVKEYVFEGYDVNALHYLLKPVKREQVFKALDKAAEKLKDMDRHIIINNIKLLQKDILYIEAQAHYLHVVTADETIVVKRPLKEMFDELDSKLFDFCHRSYIANIMHIKQILKDTIVLDNDANIPVSRSKYKQINNRFINFYKGSIDNEL